MRSLGTKAIAVLCGLWVTGSVVATLWSRPAEALAFGSFVIAVVVVIAVGWPLTDPDG